MTYLEICQTVRQECGVQGQGPSAVTSQTGLLKRIVDWVAEADMLIQSKWSDWDFLWAEFSDNTTAGSDELTKPTDLGMWDRESFSVARGTANGRELPTLDYKEWRKLQNLKINAEPYSITILPNGNLKTFQPADAIYNIQGNYWVAPTRLAADADVPVYPARFHRILVERAKMMFYSDQEAWENYRESEMEFARWMNELEGYALPSQQWRSQSQPDQMAVKVL